MKQFKNISWFSILYLEATRLFILISLNLSNKHVFIKNKKCTDIYIYIIALLLKCDPTINEALKCSKSDEDGMSPLSILCKIHFKFA